MYCTLSNAYQSLGGYSKAIEYHTQHLAIAITDIRGTRVGGETAGGSVSGRWSLVASAEILGCPGPTVPLGWRYVWYFGTRGLWYLWIFGSSDSIGTSGQQKSRLCAFLRVVWFFGYFLSRMARW